MKRLILSASVLGALCLLAGGQTAESNLGLPPLHVIKEITLSPSYSCRSSSEFQKGYADTALYLSGQEKRLHGPNLLFNGGCDQPDYFEASTGGDGMSLIADLGTKISLEDLSAHLAFNVENVHSFPAYSKFARAVKVEAHHTYAVLLNESDLRGLFVFSVDEYVPNQKVSLRYAVQSYQLSRGGWDQSPGFDWATKNARQ